MRGVERVASGRDASGRRVLVLRSARRLEVREYAEGKGGHATFQAVRFEGTAIEVSTRYSGAVAQLRGRVVEVRVP